MTLLEYKKTMKELARIDEMYVTEFVSEKTEKKVNKFSEKFKEADNKFKSFVNTATEVFSDNKYVSACFKSISEDYSKAVSSFSAMMEKSKASTEDHNKRVISVAKATKERLETLLKKMPIYEKKYVKAVERDEKLIAAFKAIGRALKAVIAITLKVAATPIAAAAFGVSKASEKISGASSKVSKKALDKMWGKGDNKKPSKTSEGDGSEV